ncbi:hypothetical protein [Nocardia noduli]|uniref:hypothetical protein n=1 Tax=Nocardia noduli TaxID=2815722 RepID=UPI001C244B09|nr:hypothetical protein [Nocardia noduli]
MTDTPSHAPRDPAREAPPQGGGGQYAAGQGQHEAAQPHPAEPGTPHARHEMAGGAGYPQFDGPGAAQYGNEPVEPPPPIAYSPQPTYGPQGTGPGTLPPDDSGVDSSHQHTYGYQTVGQPVDLDVGNAISYGLEKFRANPAPWLGITAMGIVIYLVFWLLVRIFAPNSFLPVVLLFLTVMAAVWLLQAAMVRGALYETDGNKPAFGSYFRFVNAGNVLLTAMLAFIGTWIGLAFCVIPGLIVGYLCMFALHFVVDQDQGPFSAIKSSAVLVVSNLGQTLLLALAVAVITLVGTLLCGLGLLVAGPVSVIAVTFAYRGLTGGVVAP